MGRNERVVQVAMKRKPCKERKTNVRQRDHSSFSCTVFLASLKECACSNGVHDRLKMVVKSRLVNTPLLQV